MFAAPRPPGRWWRRQSSLAVKGNQAGADGDVGPEIGAVIGRICEPAIHRDVVAQRFEHRGDPHIDGRAKRIVREKISHHAFANSVL